MAKRKDSSQKLFVAIDANSLVHRAFHAFPATLLTSDGVQVNAVYGFTSMLLRILDELDPKYLVCAFDMREPTFRHTEFTDYKATRKPTDMTLIDQFPMVKEILAAFNVPILERSGFEADDILGTLATYARDGRWAPDHLEFIIATGDKDLLQMVGGNVKVWLPRGSFKDLVMYDKDEVESRFGFAPEMIPDFKGLVGDPSDNIPGVKGIGEKSATELIQAFGHLEGIYQNLEKIKERQKNLLHEGEEQAEMSRRLALIQTDVGLEVKLEDCLMRDFARKDVIEIFQRFEFRSLMKKIPESINDGDGEQFGMFSGGDTADKTQRKSAAKVPDGKVLEIDKLKVSEKEEYCIVYHGGVLGIGQRGNPWEYFISTSGVEEPSVREKIIQILTSAQADSVITYGWEELWRDLVRKDIIEGDVKKVFDSCGETVFDISLAAYHLSSGQREYGLNDLAFSYPGVMLPDEDIWDQSDISLYIRTAYDIAEILKKAVQEREDEQRSDDFYHSIRRGSRSVVDMLWREVEMPLSLVLAHMSKDGVAIDGDALEAKQKELLEKKGAIEAKIFESIGHEFNVNSSRQLADVLFTELSLPIQRKGKSGPSTDESVLKKLTGMHPVIEEILNYREIAKMENTYVTPLLEYIRTSHDARVHSTFSQTGTTTGRLSSSDPNLQNIPIRSELGKEIRDLFVAPKGRVLISADYSQIDLRIMAHFSRDSAMLEDFEKGTDFHTATAARVLEKKESDITKDDRRVAKTINFGVLYGLSPFGLSETLSIERAEAKEYIERYFDTYSGVKSYLEASENSAMRRGFVETAFGRRRYVSGLSSNNRVRRAAAVREAVNTPIQGTSADIMRIAMNDLYKHILEEKIDASLVLQIHDEFLIECDKDVAKSFSSDVRKIMEKVMEFRVPLRADVEIGSSLASMEKVAG